MKKLLLLLCFLAVPVFAQNDPKNSSPVVVMNNVSATTTSVPYANIVVAPNEVIWVQAFGTGVGTLEIQGTLDTEANVLGSTATYFMLYSTTTLPNLFYFESPCAYVRFKWTRTSGNLTVMIRSASGSTFRAVQ